MQAQRNGDRQIDKCSAVLAVTVDGTVDLKIPTGVQPGATLLMAKRGVPKLGNPNVRGDQYVKVKVTIPNKISNEEKALVEELDKNQK